MANRCRGLFPFVPSGKDFAAAIAFFEEIGFARQWQSGDLAGLRFDEAFFILQRIDVPAWQENQMLTIEVDNLDAYWAGIDCKGLPERYPGVHLRAPEVYPWGREAHIVDPAGVCWHVRQQTAAA